jgi:molybdopterin-guanine dinucleotide biosynthesis protein A
MNSSDLKLTGILLAGGLSRRMGREKGLLKLGNRLLYTYPLRVLESCCEEILISTCHDSVLPEAYPSVCDQVPGIGPMGGIYTCLNRSSNDVNVVLSYDMPLITADLVHYLVTRLEDFEVVVPTLKDRRPEPLCAIYRKSSSHYFKELIDRKEYAVHQVFAMARTSFVPVGPALPFYRPALFANINQEKDLEKLPRDIRGSLHEG